MGGGAAGMVGTGGGRRRRRAASCRHGHTGDGARSGSGRERGCRRFGRQGAGGSPRAGMCGCGGAMRPAGRGVSTAA
jgi:hypothetical protein